MHTSPVRLQNGMNIINCDHFYEMIMQRPAGRYIRDVPQSCSELLWADVQKRKVIMYKVGNYEFETKTQADTAQKELEGIRYIRSQTDMDDPDVVLQLYNSLILKEVFVTPVGFDFLRQLQEYLNTIPYIKNEDILPIPVYRPELIEEEDSEEERELRAKAAKRRQKKQRELKAQQKRKNRDYHGAYVVSTFFAVVFAMIIIGMFAITYFSDDNVTILNYENKIIDKYEEWQKSLDEREQQLDERESELMEREEQLQEVK